MDPPQLLYGASWHHQRFLLTVSEYQIARDIPENAAESDILKVIREDNLVPLETIRLSVSNTIESSVKIGRVVSAIAGRR